MGSIEKFLRKLPKEERQAIKKALVSILLGEVYGFDVKKLQGYKNVYRIRIGSIRIVFSKEGENFNVIFVGRRGDSKYKQF